jgi:DNA-binding beta-propeller fold protein YncE
MTSIDLIESLHPAINASPLAIQVIGLAPNAAAWIQIDDEAIAVVIGESSSTYQLAEYTIATLIAALPAALGATLKAADWADVGAHCLIPAAHTLHSGQAATLGAYTAGLWRVVRPLAAGLRQSGRDTGLLLQQTDIRLVAGAWLDFWGILWNVPRLAGESDPDYRRRFLYELTLPRTTAGGIARLIELSEGYRGTVVDAPTAGHFEVTLEVPTDVDVESEFDRISALIDRYKAVGTTYTLYMRGLVVLSLPAEGIQASYLDFPDQYARSDAIAGNAMRDYIAVFWTARQDPVIHYHATHYWYYLSLINWRTHEVQHIPIQTYETYDLILWRDGFSAENIPFGIAYDPLRRSIYISATSEWQIDTPGETGDPVPPFAHMTYVPETHEIWASSGKTEATYDSIQIIDQAGATTEFDIIPSYERIFIQDVLYVPSTGHVYVIDRYYARILQIDPIARSVVAEMPTGTNWWYWPGRMIYHAPTDRILLLQYVFHSSSGAYQSLGSYGRHPGCIVNAIDPATLVITQSSVEIGPYSTGIMDEPANPFYEHLVYVPTTDAIYLITGREMHRFEGTPNTRGVARLNPATLAFEATLDTTPLSYRTHCPAWHQSAQCMYAFDEDTIDGLHIVAFDDLAKDDARSFTVPLPDLPGNVTVHSLKTHGYGNVAPIAYILTDYRAGLQYDLGRATLED